MFSSRATLIHLHKLHKLGLACMHQSMMTQSTHGTQQRRPLQVLDQSSVTRDWRTSATCLLLSYLELLNRRTRHPML